jgi:hypothetical protein
MTLAQMLMLDEALAQLGGKREGATPAAKKPRRLKGQRKAEFFRMMREQARADQ